MSDLIEATTSGFKDMADSTLRISFDIEPRFAAEAFALFGKRGSSVAIAALNLQATTAQAQQETINNQPKGGALSKWLAIKCAQEDFWLFVASLTGEEINNFNHCDLAIKNLLGITSKRDLDNDKEAEQRFHTLIRKPYQDWLLDEA